MGLLIAVAFARLIGFLGVLGFTYGMIVYTGSTAFLWLLLLIFSLGVIPTFGLEKGMVVTEEKAVRKDEEDVKSDDLFD